MTNQTEREILKVKAEIILVLALRERGISLSKLQQELVRHGASLDIEILRKVLAEMIEHQFLTYRFGFYELSKVGSVLINYATTHLDEIVKKAENEGFETE